MSLRSLGRLLHITRHHTGANRSNVVGMRHFRATRFKDERRTALRASRAIGELLVLNDELREAIVVRAPARRLKELAIASGSRLMRTTALDLVQHGQTTLMEANRVTALA